MSSPSWLASPPGNPRKRGPEEINSENFDPLKTQFDFDFEEDSAGTIVATEAGIRGEHPWKKRSQSGIYGTPIMPSESSHAGPSNYTMTVSPPIPSIYQVDPRNKNPVSSAEDPWHQSIIHSRPMRSYKADQAALIEEVTRMGGDLSHPMIAMLARNADLRQDVRDLMRQNQTITEQIEVGQKRFMDMCLSNEMTQKHLKYTNRTVDILKRRAEKLEEEMLKYKAEYELEKSKLEEKVDGVNALLSMQKARTTAAESEANMWRSNADHSHDVVQVMEEDVEELRRIHNEERAKVQKEEERKSWPPTYDSVYHKPECPQQFEDSGALDVAIFKRTMRTMFANRRNEAQRRSESNRPDPEYPEASPDSLFFSEISKALMEAARNADDVMKVSSDFYADSTTREDAPTFAQHEVSKHCYIADRLGKFLIDLAVHAASALGLRPRRFSKCHTLHTNIKLAWSKVDETLSEMLRRTFNQQSSEIKSGGKRMQRMYSLQHYLTLVQMLQEKMAMVGLHICGLEYLGSSYSWLSDQVETERALLAVEELPTSSGEQSDDEVSINSSEADEEESDDDE